MTKMCSGVGVYGADLFTSPEVPRCENTFTAQYRLQGSIDGQDVNYGDGFISFLDSNNLSFAALHLTWSDPLAEDTAIPLTGEARRLGAVRMALLAQILCCALPSTTGGTPNAVAGCPGVFTCTASTDASVSSDR